MGINQKKGLMCNENMGETITIEGLSEQLEYFINFRQVTRYFIYEDFKKHKSECTIDNLICTVDSNIITFNNLADNLFYDGTKVLEGFLESSILNISSNWEEGTLVYIATIYFKDGKIVIKAIID